MKDIVDKIRPPTSFKISKYKSLKSYPLKRKLNGYCSQTAVKPNLSEKLHTKQNNKNETHSPQFISTGRI